MLSFSACRDRPGRAATHGTASLSADGHTVLFTPEAGYSGIGTITFRADDGILTSAPRTIDVNISSVSLVNIRLKEDDLQLHAGKSATLHIIGELTNGAVVHIHPSFDAGFGVMPDWPD